MTQPPLTSPFSIGPVTLPNRVLLAPLAGIGNWFVRLQAHRHGAGLAVSEMVSSFAIAHRNRRTVEEMLRVHPDEGPVSIQLFGADPDVMREAAAVAAAAGPALIDLNMGCPVPKVLKTGAGAALIADPALAVAVARAAIEGSGLPVTVKVRSGIEPADHSGLELARRLVCEAGVSAVALHPRPAKQFHRGRPEYGLVRELGAMLDREGSRVPLIVSGGLRSVEQVRRAYEESGADAVMIARGSLGNPWIFDRLTGARESAPTAGEIEAELRWILDRAGEHWGPERAARNLRKFYPWYVERLGYEGAEADRFQRTNSLDEVRELLDNGASAPTEAAISGRVSTPL
ncbi:MAG: tRNA-dihydrouridine synthase [Solirubrobacterales bacterium]|nr:tRNA-dihydrouridine synthase [Solirubrobacterales bacterium]